MNGKTAKQIRKLIEYNIKQRRLDPPKYNKVQVGAFMGKVAQIHPDGSIQSVMKEIPLFTTVADEERRMYKLLKKGFNKFNDSEMADEIKKDLKIMKDFRGNNPSEDAEEA